MKRKLIAALLFLAALVSVFTFAPAAAEAEVLTAEIMNAKGGAAGIISMTFDDGYYQTALVLEELFEKYDLTGSLMLIADNLRNAPDGTLASPEKWRELFAKGYLEPQNHSMSHANLTSQNVENQNAATYKVEMLDSRDKLEEYFPEYDFITYAVPYSGLSYGASEYIKGKYYAVRTVNSAVVQTIDPGFGTKNGDWNKIICPAVTTAGVGTEAQWEYLKNMIDAHANDWYVPIVHRVGDVELTDLPYDMADRVFAYIASLRNQGKVWVTTFSEATKYVRERQNSRASVYVDGGYCYVSVAMEDYTADDMYLDPEIFDTPITVKVRIPDNYGSFYYTTAGVEYIAQPFSENGATYAYVDVCPNTTVKLRKDNSHNLGDWTACDENQHKRVCVDCGFVNYSEHVWNEGEVAKAPTHIEEGERACECILCHEDHSFAIEKDPVHTFDKESTKGKYLASSATCTEPRYYYYSCECGAAGDKTFSSGKAIGHKLSEWFTVKAATDSEDGKMERSCICGYIEEQVIPRTSPLTPPQNDDVEGASDGGSFDPIIIILIGAPTVAAGGAVTLFVLKKRKNT